MDIQSLDYFKQTFGKGANTVLHRMRAWYRQHMKTAAAKGELEAHARYVQREAVLTAYIAQIKQR